MTDEENKIETIKWLIDYVERDTRQTLIKEAAGYEAIKKIIGEAPQKKFPRWLDMGDSYECSDCGYESKYPEKMCPNCHATMANYDIPKNEIVYSIKEQPKSYFEKMGFFQKADELTKLLLENPGVPLLFMAGEDANIGDYSTMTCSSISYELTEALDCDYGDRIYTDRDEFRDDFESNNWYNWCESYKYLSDEPDPVREEEFQEYISEKIKGYDSYWRKCILVTVDN